MEYVVNGYYPEKVFRYFEELCAIPHGSGDEGAVADWLVAFAEQRGLSCYRDDYQNVLIRMPATKGREDQPAILLQGHTDMVCEKNGDTVHDFTKDPLALAVADGQLFALGTTLGGDDGIAVAIMMAILDGELASHPALECLFTTSEETGLIGATHFDYGQITARTMINMDSEALGEVTSGCAGGVRSELSLVASRIGVEGQRLTVDVKGLCGGHSGECIHMGRANANKVMGRLLTALSRQYDFNLLTIGGGSKDNAIPRECHAELVTKDALASAELLKTLAEDLRKELTEADSGFSVETAIFPSEPFQLAMGAFATRNILALLANVTVGVMAMSHDVPGLVEFSRNLGVVRTENNTVQFVFSSRSAIDGQLDSSIAMLDAFASLIGAKTRHHSRYPGWEYAKQSRVRERYLEAYRRVTGKEAKVTVIHAGLECGIIKHHIPDMDMISVGPDMKGIHSPDEKLDLRSVETFWKVIAQTISGD